MPDTIRKPFTKAEMDEIRRSERGEDEPRGLEDEGGVLRAAWTKIKRFGRRLPFAEDLVAAYFCATDSKTPSRVRFILMGALAYFVLPTDAVADFLPIIGFTDDAAVLAAAIAQVAAHITPDHRERAREMLADGDERSFA
jgi:uncharacterized membrane protein YkvA (DUF1232 family)